MLVSWKQVRKVANSWKVPASHLSSSSRHTLVHIITFCFAQNKRVCVLQNKFVLKALLQFFSQDKHQRVHSVSKKSSLNSEVFLNSSLGSNICYSISQAQNETSPPANSHSTRREAGLEQDKSSLGVGNVRSAWLFVFWALSNTSCEERTEVFACEALKSICVSYFH